MTYADTSIRFPPVTLSSKLSTKMLKKTPESMDWIQQSYLEMIQDISCVPSSQQDSVDSSDSESECHTITTSSTDGNRKNNIYEFYRQQQELMRPIDEQLAPTLPIAECNRPTDSIDEPPTRQNKKKKKFHLVKRLIIKMRDTAEKPFQSIDHRF